jgi:hypothetical protein
MKRNRSLDDGFFLRCSQKWAIAAKASVDFMLTDVVLRRLICSSVRVSGTSSTLN